jgi:hypothetical protein
MGVPFRKVDDIDVTSSRMIEQRNRRVEVMAYRLGRYLSSLLQYEIAFLQSNQPQSVQPQPKHDSKKFNLNNRLAARLVQLKSHYYTKRFSSNIPPCRIGACNHSHRPLQSDLSDSLERSQPPKNRD